MIDQYEINVPDVVSEILDGETVVLDFASGRYYSLNPAATRIWHCLSSDEHGEPADLEPPQVARFLGRLQEEGLIRLRDGKTKGVELSAEQQLEEPAFDSDDPQLERFDDLENLLLLDPIHDVSAEGWPQQSTGPNSDG